MPVAQYTLSRLYDDVNKRVVDESGGTVTTGIVTSYANESLRTVQSRWDIPNTKYISQLVAYQDVTTYPNEDGYKDFSNLTLQEQLNDPLSVRYVAEPDFWRNFPTGQVVASDGRNGPNRYFLLNLNNTLSLSSQLLNSCDTYNGNGTWVASTATSDAASVATDTLYYRQGTGSVRFNITVGQSVNNYAEISNSTMTAVSLATDALQSVGTLFMWVYLPSAVNYTSFTARWGSSSANYYENTVTTQFSGNPFVQGWNLLGFDWVSATTVGTPNNLAINYTLFRATYPASFVSQTGLRIDWVIMRQKALFNKHFYSDYAVIDGTTSLPKEGFTSSTDVNSYLNMDSMLLDWVFFDVMENIYVNVIQYPSGQALYANKKLAKEDDINRRYPSQKPPVMLNYTETENIPLN